MKRRDWLASALIGAAVPPLPSDSMRTANADAYWAQVRQDQFLLPEWRVFLNNGSLGITPKRVLNAVTQYMENAAALASDDYPRWGYETLDEERTTMATFVGCKKDELAFTHNATEAMSTIAEGLDLKSGDEVVMTNEEHPSGKSPWHRRAQRDGVAVREIVIPHPPKNSGELADRMISGLGPRTRVLSFSGIITSTGTIMPVKEICDAARAKGVITVVDGAHMNGQIHFRMSDLGCDYFAGSPHKWMFAPAGCGLLYIREENLDRLWPSITTGGWDSKDLKAARFMKIGTNNRATIVGMMEGLAFLQQLGPENVYGRIHDMAKRNYAMAAQRSYLKVLSSPDDRLYGSLVCIQLPEKGQAELWAKFKQQRVWTLVGPRLRLSTHIHTRPQDLETFYSIADEVFGKSSKG